MANETEKIGESRIPTIRTVAEADETALEQMYDRIRPGSQTNLKAVYNGLGIVVERGGKITAALMGNWATVAQVVVLADPEASASEDATHDVGALTDALLHMVRLNTAPGTVVGMIAILPESLRCLGEAMDRRGFLSQNAEFSAHVALVVNTPLDPVSVPS